MSSQRPTYNFKTLKFKFRAECMIDANRLKKVLKNKYGWDGYWHMDGDEVVFEVPQIDGTFNTEEKLLDLISEEVVDSHVITDTLALVEEYTGERDYGERLKRVKAAMAAWRA